MEEAKKKKIIWISIILLVLIGILLLIFRVTDTSVDEPEIFPQPEFTPPSANLEYDSTIEPSVTNTEFTILNLAKSYSERFGSWSTDSMGYNLEELLPLSSNKMKNYLNSIKLDETEEFSGVTTKSISADLLFIDSAKAEVMVNTQRISTDNNLEEEIAYQDIQISLIYSGTEWLVDATFWQ